MLSKRQLEVLQHAVGVDQYGRGDMYRNHYAASGDDIAVCEELAALGYMGRCKRVDWIPDPLFYVTDGGRAVVARDSPKPPKLTPGQKRYLDFLAASEAFGCTFREWLDMRKTDWYRQMKGA
jgi:hypothetical protein